MKYLILIAALFIVACDPQIKDPLVGNDLHASVQFTGLYQCQYNYDQVNPDGTSFATEPGKYIFSISQTEDEILFDPDNGLAAGGKVHEDTILFGGNRLIPSIYPGGYLYMRVGGEATATEASVTYIFQFFGDNGPDESKSVVITAHYKNIQRLQYY